MNKVSAIIPAYNEEKHIEKMLISLINSSYIDEVICVDDGSEDSTLKVVRSVKGVRVLHYRKNHGKAYAVARGIEKAQGEIILLLDADIRGLTDKNIRKFVLPLKTRECDLTIGYCSSRIESSVAVPLSGQRAYFKKNLLPHIRKFENKGYGLELYLNYQFRNKKKKIFKLDGVFSYSKGEKYSDIKAIKLYGDTTFQVVREIFKRKNAASYFINAYLFYIHLNDQSLREYLSYKSLRGYIRI